MRMYYGVTDFVILWSNNNIWVIVISMIYTCKFINVLIARVCIRPKVMCINGVKYNSETCAYKNLCPSRKLDK